MELLEKQSKQSAGWREELLIFLALLGFGFFVNRGVELKGLYMDDLYLWSCYGEQSFLEYVFPVGGTRFRFVFYLASWLELLFLGNHVEWMLPFNILLNAGIAYSIYRMGRHFSNGRKLVSLAAAVAFLVSRLAYYQIGQFYGLMETLGLWAAIAVLYFLYRYVNERQTGAFLWANLLYFLASFIHERYLVLLPVLFIALALSGIPGGRIPKREAARQAKEEPGNGQAGAGRPRSRRRAVKEGKLFLLTTAVFAMILLLRFLFIGELAPAGTGGTEVADTFTMESAMANAWAQVGFVFGYGSGPDYLCIQPFKEAPDHIALLTHGANAALAVLVAVFLIFAVQDKKRWISHLKNIVLFLAFIMFCIASSSVTIRVEMRWVYVVFAAALLFMTYMTARVGRAAAVVFLYLALLIPVESYYRENWEAIHLWPNQLRYNSLAEETIGRYGTEIFDKNIYIIGNTYEMSEFTAETFLKVYDPKGEGKNHTIQFIDSDFDFKQITDQMVILREDPQNNAYQDVTEFVKQQRFHRAYGSYEDGWTDENAKFVFLTGQTNVVKLNCYYPGKITGNEVCKIQVNGRAMPDLVFTENAMTYEIPAAPYEMISLELSCNFYVKDAKEKRGEENLAMIVEIEAKQ